MKLFTARLSVILLLLAALGIANKAFAGKSSGHGEAWQNQANQNAVNTYFKALTSGCSTLAQSSVQSSNPNNIK